MAEKKQKTTSERIDKTIITSISGLIKDKPKKAYLFFMAGPLLGKFFALNEGETILGRSPECEISINDNRVSRNHLKITVKEENVVAEDLGSTNGTFVNGEKITVQKLEPNDKVQISPATIFKFSLADEDEKVAINELYELGVLDPLTNSYNKRYFTGRLKEELSHSRRLKVPISLLMLDIDFFKKINDTYGHLAGDKVLVKTAHVLASLTRHEDIVARYGGEEFAVILRNTDKEGAKLLAERIRNTVMQTAVSYNDSIIRITISIGSVTSSENQDVSSIDEFISAADKALYYSKEHGRNCTTLFSDIRGDNG